MRDAVLDELRAVRLRMTEIAYYGLIVAGVVGAVLVWYKMTNFDQEGTVNPQTQKLLTLLGTVAAGMIASAAVTHGFIKQSDQTVIVDAIVALFGASGVIGGALFKNSQNTPAAVVAEAVKTNPQAVIAEVAKVEPKAVIAAVNNADNGVMVVSDNTVAKMVTEPLK